MRGQAFGLLQNEKLLGGFAKLGLGELVVRISRVLTAIVLARNLGAAELGVAATAIACFELVRVLANNCGGQMVIRAQSSHLAATCNTAFKLTCAMCAAMVVIQLIAGLVIARITGRPELLGMIACLAATFVFLPWGMVQSWLLQRDYRMGTQSGINALQAGSDNLLTALLAICGAGAWAIVLPKLLTTPIWLICVRRAQRWKLDPAAGNVPYRSMIKFSAPILASELLVAVRFNVDKLLVGSILGLEALGIYYFAFSAGYGLSLVLTSALATASYPYLCDGRLSAAAMIARFDQALLKLAVPISALIVLQAMAVFFYVPLLFGEKWAPMTMVVAILCLSAATKSWQDLSAQLLRAAGKPGTELMASCVFTVFLLAFLALGLQFGLLAGVGMLTMTTVSMQILFAVWARSRVGLLHEAPSAGVAASTTGSRS